MIAGRRREEMKSLSFTWPTSTVDDGNFSAKNI
jgi:hypothetical protein